MKSFPLWAIVALVFVAAFPPYTQKHAYNPQIESAAGWTFVGAVGERQSIRWQVLALEAAIVVGAGLASARRGPGGKV